MEVTADEIGARHGQDEYGFKPSYVKSRIIKDSSVFKTAKGGWAAKPLGSARRFRTKKAAKAALKQRIAAKSNDDQIRELNKQAGAEITAMKLEQDKLRREKSDIETRSPVVKAGGGMDDLERSRQQMAVENEKVTLGAKLTAAEYEERNKEMVKEKQVTITRVKYSHAFY